MKIYAPVKDTNGVYATVRFINGVGETDNSHLIEWFKKQGYRLEENNLVINKVNLVIEQQNDEIEQQNDEVKNNEPNFDEMQPNELREWMRTNGYGSKIKNTKNKEKLLEILRGD